ncbi:Zn(2)-C6 fungal-type domain-containing protein [Pleurotus pulmonarius]
MDSYTNYEHGRPAKRARSSPDAPSTIGGALGDLGQMSKDPSPTTMVLPAAARPTTSKQENVSTAVYRKEARSSKTLSCNECRRLKLKCDRVFPCQSCCKRGCAEICPDGTLTSGRGSRFILANTEQLHEKINQLCDRVKLLEEALEVLQARSSPDTHPLLAPELLRIKSTFSIETEGVPTSLPSAARTHGADKHLDEPPFIFGQNRSRLNESGEDTLVDSPNSGSRASSSCSEVPNDLLQLSSTFPVPWAIDLKLRKRIRDCLPPRNEAETLCQAARRNALWQFDLDSSNTFLDNLLHHVYSTTIEELSPRRLALLLMNLAIGSVVSESEPIGSLSGEAYHHLSRAALCEIPLLDIPEFDLVHTIFYMIWYQLMFSDNKDAVTYAWNLMGFVSKLSQGLGLHRDTSRSKVIPEEDDRRRAVFWELVNIDTRLSLSLGRPPSLYVKHIDTRKPVYQVYHEGRSLDGYWYHEWKTKFLTGCLDPILQATIQIDPPPYSHIIHLDTLVRDFPAINLLQGNSKPTRSLRMQNAVAVTGLEIAILQLHRRYFLKALSNSGEFDLEHDYAPSVVATCIAATSLISTTEELFNWEADLTARFLHFWFNAFSAGVALCLVVVRAPTSPLSSYALQSMRGACLLFQRGAKLLPFCAKALPVLEKLTLRSQLAYNQHSPQNGSDFALQGDGETHGCVSSGFTGAHVSLRRCAENIMAHSRNVPGSRLASPLHNHEEWRVERLPDVYGFNSLGFGTGDRFSREGEFARLLPHPFAPCSPRIAEDEPFNLECGALTLDLTNTSYMAWF